uniref:bromodomain adjacent to zinc finger domain protein 2B isoform X3 n=1 Tax=Myxine glutinosa TaxID=7769 RepID=UPI00358DF521
MDSGEGVPTSSTLSPAFSSSSPSSSTSPGTSKLLPMPTADSACKLSSGSPFIFDTASLFGEAWQNLAQSLLRPSPSDQHFGLFPSVPSSAFGLHSGPGRSDFIGLGALGVSPGQLAMATAADWFRGSHSIASAVTAGLPLLSPALLGLSPQLLASAAIASQGQDIASASLPHSNTMHYGHSAQHGINGSIKSGALGSLACMLPTPAMTHLASVAPSKPSNRGRERKRNAEQGKNRPLATAKPQTLQVIKEKVPQQADVAATSDSDSHSDSISGMSSHSELSDSESDSEEGDSDNDGTVSRADSQGQKERMKLLPQHRQDCKVKSPVLRDKNEQFRTRPSLGVSQNNCVVQTTTTIPGLKLQTKLSPSFGLSPQLYSQLQHSTVIQSASKLPSQDIQAPNKQPSVIQVPTLSGGGAGVVSTQSRVKVPKSEALTSVGSQGVLDLGSKANHFLPSSSEKTETPEVLRTKKLTIKKLTKASACCDQFHKDFPCVLKHQKEQFKVYRKAAAVDASPAVVSMVVENQKPRFTTPSIVKQPEKFVVTGVRPSLAPLSQKTRYPSLDERKASHTPTISQQKVTCPPYSSMSSFLSHMLAKHPPNGNISSVIQQAPLALVKTKPQEAATATAGSMAATSLIDAKPQDLSTSRGQAATAVASAITTATPSLPLCSSRIFPPSAHPPAKAAATPAIAYAKGRNGGPPEPGLCSAGPAGSLTDTNQSTALHLVKSTLPGIAEPKNRLVIDQTRQVFAGETAGSRLHAAKSFNHSSDDSDDTDDEIEDDEEEEEEDGDESPSDSDSDTESENNGVEKASDVRGENTRRRTPPITASSQPEHSRQSAVLMASLGYHSYAAMQTSSCSLPPLVQGLPSGSALGHPYGSASRSDSTAKRRKVVDERQLQNPLDHGWRRETRIRTVGGKLQGEVVYYSPCGRKHRQYPEVIKYLSRNRISNITRDNFSFSTKMRVGDFYETREGPQGLQWYRLLDDDIGVRIKGMEGRRGRPPNPEHRVQEDQGPGKARRRKGRPANVERRVDTVRRVESLKLFKKLEAQAIARQAAELKLMQRLEKQARVQAAKQARKQQAIQVAEAKRKQKEQLKMLKQQEKMQRIEQQRKEREMRAQQIVEAKRRRKEQAANARVMEAERRAQEKELRRQHAVILKHQERERRRQELLLLKALEAQKKAEEKERLKQERVVEKQLNKERRQEMRRLELQIALEMKKPNEDLCLTEQKPLPELSRIPGLALPGPAFSDCLMVIEFMRSFGKVLGFDVTRDVPSLASLQEGLLSFGAPAGELLDLTARLLHSALKDPGLPPGFKERTVLGCRLRDLELNRKSVSEALRLFLEARGGLPVLARSLRTCDIQAHPPAQKAEALAFLCDELLCSRIITMEIDKTIDQISSLRRDKWIVEGKLRSLKAQHSRKTGRQLWDGRERRSGGSRIGTHIRKRKRQTCDSDESPEEEEEEESEAEHDEDEEEESREDRMKQPKIDVLCEEVKDISASVNEIEKQMEKLTKQQKLYRRKLFEASHCLRATSLGQDRYRRRYWMMPHCGGLFIEGMESAESSEEVKEEQERHKLASATTSTMPKIKKEPESRNENTNAQNGNCFSFVIRESVASPKAANKTQLKDTSMHPVTIQYTQEKNGKECQRNLDGTNLFLQKPGMLSKFSELLEVAKMVPDTGAAAQQLAANGATDISCRISNSHSPRQNELQSPTLSNKMEVPPLHISCGSKVLFSADQLLKKLSTQTKSPMRGANGAVGDDASSQLPQIVSSQIPCSTIASGKLLSMTTVPSTIPINPFQLPASSALAALQLKSGLPLLGLPLGGWPAGLLSPGLPFSGPLLSLTLGLPTSTTQPVLVTTVPPAPTTVKSPPSGGTIPKMAPGNLSEIQKQTDQPQPKPIPEELRTGWWRVADPETLRALLKALHPRGVREKVLQKQLQKHMDFACQACARAKDVFPVGKNEKAEQATATSREVVEKWSLKQQARRIDMSVLHMVEELEARVASASLQVKGWRCPEKVSCKLDVTFSNQDNANKAKEAQQNRPENHNGGSCCDRLEEKVADEEKRLPKDERTTENTPQNERVPQDEVVRTMAYSCNRSADRLKNGQGTHWKDGEQDVDEAHIHKSAQPLEQAVRRLALLERHIERRYLRSPLSTTIQIQLRDVGTVTVPAPAPGENCDGERVEDEIAPGLKEWRRVLQGAENAAQVALCLEQLDKSIAWEKSIMKVFCQICRKGDNEELLLLCDGCDRGCHTYCHRPKLPGIPEGDWYCPACISKVTSPQRPPSANNSPEKLPTVPSPTPSPKAPASAGSQSRSPSCSRVRASPVSGTPPKFPKAKTNRNRKSTESKKKTMGSLQGQQLVLGKLAIQGNDQDSPTPSHQKGGREMRKRRLRDDDLEAALLLSLRESQDSKGRTPFPPITTTVADMNTGIKATTNLSSTSLPCQTTHSLGPTPLPTQSATPIQTLAPTPAPSPGLSHSPSHSPARKVRTTSEGNPDLTPCRTIMGELEAHTDAWPFLQPVNSKLVPGYRTVIRRPMDFATMREKLETGQYNFRESFSSDTRLVFKNCERFNEDESEVGRAGHSMARFFENRWVQLCNGS